jgi:hypothetical protein
MRPTTWPVCTSAVIWLAAAATACVEPRCPKGYDQKEDRCYRIKDAGTDGATEGDSGSDEGDSGGDSGSDEGDDDAGDDDAGDNSADSGGEIEASLPSCSLECGEKQVCQVVDDADTCTCATGYMECDGECLDVMSDPQNCGSCGYACAEGLSCKQGECEQRIRELVLEADVSCALYDSPDGNFPFKCWGDSRFGLFRVEVAEVLAPRAVVGVARVRGLAVPPGRYCAVLPGEETIRCWGQCGLECGNPAESPTTGATFSRDVAVAGVVRISGAGYGYQSGWNTCALAGSGRIDCWGSNYLIASNDGRHTPAPILVEGISTFGSLDGASSHTCATTADGRVGCWGWHTGDALGFAAELVSVDDALSGVFVPKESGGILTGARKVAAGINSCAVTQDGELWCWGSNDGRGSTDGPGMLGVGDTARHVGAVKVPLDHVADVDVGGGSHACAIARGGQVYCWGRIERVGLGTGIFGDVHDGRIFSTPQVVPGITDAVEIRTGSAHTCVRRRNGQVLCWGANGRGQLGDGTKLQRLSPTPVIGLY